MSIQSLSSDLIQILVPSVKKNRHIAVAFSGGVDSTVLLYLLYQLKNEYSLSVRAIHVNHGLNPQAEEWVHHVKKICSDFEIACQVEYIAQKPGKNIEASVRKYRYEILSNALRPNEVLMTAHHLDDQTETFLLALKRGSGPRGLSSMPTTMPFASSTLIRPLLCVTKSELEAYAKAHKLYWVEDKSNWNQHFDRNFIRQTLLPILTKRWPKFNQMASRSAALCAEESTLLHELLAEEMIHCVNEDQSLCLTTLRTMSAPKRNILLRTWLNQHHLPFPSRKQLYLLWETVAEAKQDANPKMVLGEVIIRRFRDNLYITQAQAKTAGSTLIWDLSSPLILPNHLGTLRCFCNNGNIRNPLPTEEVKIRFGATARVAVVGRSHSRSLKKLWQEFAIPPWLRNKIPLLYYNEQLIAAVGVFITKEGSGHQLRLTLESSISR